MKIETIKMIFDATTLPMPLKLKTNLCIVGAGAGGSMVAMLSAQAGMKVTVLEAGSFITPDKMNQREEKMIPQLFWDSGSRTTKDRKVKIYQGKGIGGSTLHNINLCKRIPESILKEWIETNKLKYLDINRWNYLYQKVEELLNVSIIQDHMLNKHNLLLKNGCEKLGWKGGMLNHNRTGCMQSGFCELGCAFDAKNNACKIVVPQAVNAGAEFITHCQVSRIIHENGKATGLTGFVIDPVTTKPINTIEVEADQICLSASATASAAIILRSNIPFPENSVGKTLHIHPGIAIAGDFEEDIFAWKGIPQSYECTEFLTFENILTHSQKASRLWIITAFAHPMGTATTIPGHGSVHYELMKRYPNLAVFSAMLHDESNGEIYPIGDLGFTISYELNKRDASELRDGIIACTKLMFAAGAKKVLVPSNPIIEIKSENDILKYLDVRFEELNLDTTAVHPMSSIPMGDDANKFAVGSNGKYLHLDGLWVADGSLFPTSIGVPPQLSIYAMGLHVGEQIVSS